MPKFTKIVTRSKPRVNYRRKRLRKRPNVGQLNFRNVGNMTLSQAAYGAMRGLNMVKGIINSEKKRYDLTHSFSISTTPTFTLLSGLAEGDDVANRIGNSILAKYLTFDYYVSMNGSASRSTVRVLVFADTQNNGTTPAVADLLIGSNLTSPINPDNTQRFTVLFDDHIDLSQNGDGIRTIKHYIPLNFHIRYTASGGTAVTKNNIYMMVVSNEATNTPAFVGDSRLVYYDN